MIYSCCEPWGWRYTAPIRSGLRVVAQPTGEQITLDEAKLHLRVDSDGSSPPAHLDDPLIESLIVAAREWCENDTGRALVPQTLELTTSAWPVRGPWGIGDQVSLPMGPIGSVVSVTYLDAAGVSTVLAGSGYLVDNWSEPGWIYPAVDTTWPTVQSVANAIVIRYTTGFTLPTDSPNDKPLPKSIKAAMLLIVGHLYENREQSNDLKLQNIPLAAESLLDRYRLRIPIA